jgi:hypothetical protein
LSLLLRNFVDPTSAFGILNGVEVVRAWREGLLADVENELVRTRLWVALNVIDIGVG